MCKLLYVSDAHDAAQHRDYFPMYDVAGCASVCFYTHSNELLMPCRIAVAIAADVVVDVI